MVVACYPPVALPPKVPCVNAGEDEPESDLTHTDDSSEDGGNITGNRTGDGVRWHDGRDDEQQSNGNDSAADREQSA